MNLKDKIIKPTTTSPEVVRRENIPGITSEPLERRQIRGFNENELSDKLQMSTDTNLTIEFAQFIQDPAGDSITIKIRNKSTGNIVGSGSINI